MSASRWMGAIYNAASKNTRPGLINPSLDKAIDPAGGRWVTKQKRAGASKEKNSKS